MFRAVNGVDAEYIAATFRPPLSDLLVSSTPPLPSTSLFLLGLCLGLGLSCRGSLAIGSLLLQVSKNGLDYIQSALEYFCVDRMRVLSVHLGMGGSSEELACFFKFRHPAGDS